MTRRISLALFLLAPLVGCFGNEASAFPAGLEPLEDSTAPAPEGMDGEPYPEDYRLLRGETGDFHWVHARGYVLAPIEDVYAAMQVAEVCLDRRKADRWSVRDLGPMEMEACPECDNGFVIHNEVDDVVTVEFDMTWRFGVVEGTNDRPDTVTARFKKTFGTRFISRMEGNMTAIRIDDAVTEVELVEQIEAATGGGDDIESYIRDYFVDLVEQSHGRELPAL